MIKNSQTHGVVTYNEKSAAAVIELRPRFWTISLLTLRGHFPSHISKSLYRCLVADAGMPTLPVVENLGVFKDGNLGLRARFKALAVHHFFFQRSKEALHRRVI